MDTATEAEVRAELERFAHAELGMEEGTIDMFTVFNEVPEAIEALDNGGTAETDKYEFVPLEENQNPR